MKRGHWIPLSLTLDTHTGSLENLERRSKLQSTRAIVICPRCTYSTTSTSQHNKTPSSRPTSNRNGISPHTRAICRRHARRATAKGARDKTKYGTTRISTRSFYTHHTQRMSLAAVRLDAKNIRAGINRIKGDACSA